jgi:hypothetical protein
MSGYDKGMMILKEYFIGLLTFGTVPIAFALENNHILFYAQENALGLLSGEYQNPAVMPVIGPHLDYLASMAGMAGAQGLGAAMIVPGIIYGGRVAMAMGMFSGLGGMVNNKTPQGVVEDAGAERARQTAIANHSMRSELEKAGIHVGANGDVGAVYSQYQASLDKASTQFADAGTYKDHAKRFAATEAQQFGSNSAMIGAGGEAQKTGLDRVSASRKASGAAEFTGQIASGEALLKKDGTGHAAYDSTKGISEDYKKGQAANAEKQVGSIVGTGRESRKYGKTDIMDSAAAASSKALGMDMQTYKADTTKDKDGNSVIGSDGLLSDVAKKGQLANAIKSAGALIGTGNKLGTPGMSTNDIMSAAETEAGVGMDTWMAKTVGMKKNIAKNPNMYKDNAEYSETSQVQSAYGAMMKKGGKDKATDLDVAMAEDGAIFSTRAFKDKMKSLGAKGKTLTDQVDSVESEISRIAGATSRKQTQESRGATDGIEETEKKHKKDKHNPFRQVAQSGIESQVESGLGAIRGAGGIHSLANQAGIKAQSDSNALRASIAQAGGAGDYIGLNEFAARKGIAGMQSDRDGFNDTFGASGYLGQKGFAGFRLAGAATSAKGYAEMRGTANAVGNVGLDKFESNAQTEASNSAISTARKIEGAGGAQNYIIASSTSAAAQGAAMASALAGAGSQSNMIQNAAYGAFQKEMGATKEREQDLAGKLAEIDSKTGMAKASKLGEVGIENDAIEKTVQKKKRASDRSLQAEKIEAALDSNTIDRQASLAAMGIDESALKNGGKEMTADQYRKIKLNSEKKIDRTEVNVIGKDGDMASTTVRSMAQEGADGALSWKSQVENQSSLEKRERGKKIDLHAKDSLEAAGIEGAFGVFGEGAMYLAEGAVAVGVGATAAGVANKYTKGMVAVGKDASGGNIYAVAKDGVFGGHGGYAVEHDGQYFKTDADGNGILDKKGNPQTLKESQLRGGMMSGWEKAKNSAWDLKDKLSGAFSEKPVNEPADHSNGKPTNNSNDSVNSVHNNTSSSDMSNSTTSSNPMQGTKAEMYRAEQKAKIDAAFGGSNIAERFSAATEAAEHAGGKRKAIGAFAGTMLAGTAIASMFSPSAEAAEIPVNVKAVPKQAEGGMLEGIADTLGVGSLGASIAGHFSKTVAKIVPGVGAAYGVADTANREMKGDHLGAAMSATIGAVSSVPGIGTGLAIAGSLAQVATDSMGIPGDRAARTNCHSHQLLRIVQV